MDSVPVIDLGAARAGGLAERRRAARRIDDACCQIGFFAIAGHGVSPAVVSALRAAAHEFFALPLEEKLRACHPVKGTPRGYHAQGGEALAYANDDVAPPDLKEFYHIGAVDIGEGPYYTDPRGGQFFRPNIWPARPAGFRDAATAYFRRMDRLVLTVMRLVALALSLDEHFFDDKVGRSVGSMRLNWYPAQTGTPLPGQLRSGAHTDYGSITILNGEDVPGGLQVRTRAGDWIDVRTAPDLFVVNIGDLMMRWTNDRWLSNLHRVVNPQHSAAGGRPRLSIAFFNHPNWDVTIECLAPRGEAKYPPVQSGDYLDGKYRKTGLRATV
jgi:isopenicillin N synthase-like dioxygenase